jgi:SAM-dependent methyltransferase
VGDRPLQNGRLPVYSGRMVTIPPEPVRFSELEPHQVQQMGRSFGREADRYDRARPSYPDDMVRAIVAASPGREVVDVGIGTGIAARQFKAAGCRVLGVDVDERMAELARRGGFEVEVAAFEDWAPGGRNFDIVVSGQSWHWVAPVAGATKAGEALRPGGRLAVFWNVFQPPPELGEAFSRVYRRVLPESPFGRGTSQPLEAYSSLFRRATDGIAEAGSFGEVEQWRFDWERSYTRDEWLDLVPTSGGHSQFPPAKLDELLAGIGAAIDAAGGGFTMNYATVVITTLRHGTPGGT